MFESFSKDEENVFSQFFITPDSDEAERDGCYVGSSGDTAAAAAAAATDTSVRLGDIIRSVNDDNSNCIDCSAIINEEGDDDDDKHTETIYRSSSHPINITLLERLVLYHTVPLHNKRSSDN